MANRPLTALLLIGLLLLPAAGRAQSDDPRAYFTDLPVQTHRGERARFYSDLLHGHVVLISFFYVNCPTSFPSMVRFFKLQKLLGDRLGREVRMLTLTVDPDRDDVAAISTYAAKFNPREGWDFVTGDSEDLLLINRRLGNHGSLPENHLRLILIGNLNTGHWMKLVEDAPERALLRAVQTLLQEK